MGTIAVSTIPPTCGLQVPGRFVSPSGDRRMLRKSGNGMLGHSSAPPQTIFEPTKPGIRIIGLGEGCQSGNNPETPGIACNPDPSTLTMKSCCVPCKPNTIRVPSGDQLGCLAKPPPL